MRVGGIILVASAIVLTLAVLVAAYGGARADLTALATRAPERTALMRQRMAEGRRGGRKVRIQQTWVPLGRISPHLVRAVLVAEDDRFFDHGGLDWREIRASAERNWRARSVVRGGSTLTQQLAKNLWLGTARTPWRKLEELVLAIRLERALPKRRILELYLNVIEWGDGVYGAEAAARHWFGCTAAELGPEESVRLAAVIINPRRYSPLAPDRRIERRIAMIRGRLLRRGLWPADPRPEAPDGPAPRAADTLMAPFEPGAPALPDSVIAPADSITPPARP